MYSNWFSFMWGVAQLAERQNCILLRSLAYGRSKRFIIPDLDVAGSNPVAPPIFIDGSHGLCEYTVFQGRCTWVITVDDLSHIA